MNGFTLSVISAQDESGGGGGGGWARPCLNRDFKCNERSEQNKRILARVNPSCSRKAICEKIIVLIINYMLRAIYVVWF
jgi:hypothetical protein